VKTHPYLFRRFVLPVTVLIGLGVTLSQAQPANNMFANRVVITGTNIVVTGSNVGATKEPSEPNPAGNSGGASIWWSWRAPSTGSVAISTSGSSFDTILGVYVGSSVAALTGVASNDDEDNGGGIYTSKVVFNTVSNQTYQIVVDGYNGGSGAASGNVKLSVQMPPPPPPPAPAWALLDPYGATVNSSNYAGKVVILDFWATWCGPCKAEMPDLVALQAKYRTDGLVIVGADVSWSGDSAQAVQTFLGTFTPTLNYQVVMSTSATDTAYGGSDGIPAIPMTFIIDRQNLIRKQYLGTQPGSTLESQIIPLLYGNTQLTCQRSGNQMVFHWPTAAQTFTLQLATNLVNPSWSAWPAAPTVANGTNTVLVPMTNAARCFRLQMIY
jgi:thiol-disulfide isomerase/thioredoxin